MSTLTDLFTSMANKIRSKTGTQTTYTPAEMASDGIDDVYDAGYAAGGGGSSATSITPSDSSPVAMTANNAYEPTTNGYAIASNPTTLTPSNASPQSIASGTIYKSGGSGYAISSYTSISQSQLNAGVYFSSGMKKMASSGYAYSSQQSAEMDFFDTLYSTSGQQTYTFTNNLKVVYACVPTNSTSSRGTYTGSGSMTSAYTGTYQVINKITNVKSGDTFKAPSFGVSGTNRTILFFVGKKA